MSGPSFRPFPFDRLRHVTRADAAFESACARLLAVRVRGDSLAKLAGGPVEVHVVGVVERERRADRLAQAPARLEHHAGPLASTRPATPKARDVSPEVAPEAEITASGARDRGVDPIARTVIAGSSLLVEPTAAIAEIRVAGLRIACIGSGAPIRALAQRLLGGPDELAAPRPLTPAEHAIFALVLATALEDARVPGDVIARPFPDAGGVPLGGLVPIELGVRLGSQHLTVTALVPEAVEVRVPPARDPASWTTKVAFDLPIVLGRCALPREAIAALAVRDTITIERTLELVFAGGAIALEAAAGALEARVASEYARGVTLADDAQVELTVTLGTTSLTLRQLVELSVGQIVRLGRPLAGPFELRAAGKLVGQGELVDVEGELGVRVVRLGE